MTTLQDTRYVRGAEKLGKRIATIRAALSVPVIAREANELLLRRTLARFDREVDPDGKPWPALASETLARRNRANGYPGKPKLVQTGELRASIKLLRGGEGSVYTNTGAGGRIGIEGDENLVGKARAHQRGYGNIPVRRFLGIGRNDVTAVDGLMRRIATKVENL